jgi:hypothetical protein
VLSSVSAVSGAGGEAQLLLYGLIQNNACKASSYMIYSISGRETSTPSSKKEIKKELAFNGWM